ncbi:MULTISPECIES: double zinc ribbon domain-containing protein [Aerosakkonema]|uniref:double zinc ribbon domain-containing protein n=1 Tax=Aerosakkonema TaxID=1246629 RepID=UPI0035B96D5E
MLSFFRRISNKFVEKLTNIRHEPINKTSLIILILIDIFVLFNVFSGLNSISQWPLAPYEEFPCFESYQNYQTAEKKETFAFKVATIQNRIEQNKQSPLPSVDNSNRLGQVSNLCTNHTRLSKAVNTPETVRLKTSIDRLRNEISSSQQEIQTLQRQYNSTLLEKIAGQPTEKSINKVNADRIKSEIDRNQQQIADKEKQIVAQQTQLIQNPAADAYLKLLSNTPEYETLKKAYSTADFWYPNKQLLLQVLFLLPLIAIAYIWHSTAIRKNLGLQSLLSWHLLAIFCIPLIIKFFEFIQFGNLVRVAIELIVKLFGGLVFIASYAFILIIPLLGFGLIKLLQIWVFNPRVQAKKRIQKVRCINCNSKLRLSDEFCPYCGYDQYIDCSNCHQKAYKYSNFCSQCGHKIESDR